MPSGSDPVVLAGDAMVDLVRAVAAIGEAEIGRYVIVGGVAVNARLGQAHRATADVDTVVDETVPPDAVEALLTLPDARQDPTGAHRVLVHGTKVEVIRVGPLHDGDLDGVPTKDALFVASHAWALDTATALTLIAGDNHSVQAVAPFATPAALIAMKLHAIEDRSPTGGLDKRAGDAWDIYRLLLDLDANGSVTAELNAAPAALRSLVHDAAARILVTNATRTRGWLRAGDDAMAAVTTDEIKLLGEPLVALLS